MAETIPCKQLIPWSTNLENGEVVVSSALTGGRKTIVDSVVQNEEDRLAEVQTTIHLCNTCKGVFANCIFL